MVPALDHAWQCWLRRTAVLSVDGAQDRLNGEGASVNIWPAQVMHNSGKNL